jgi:hypothetical protein
MFLVVKHFNNICLFSFIINLKRVVVSFLSVVLFTQELYIYIYIYIYICNVSINSIILQVQSQVRCYANSLLSNPYIQLYQ